MRHDAADTADGTQPSEPPGSFGDPLAGVSSGERHWRSSSGASNGSDTAAPRPTAPNPETVRTLLNDVFAPASERAGADEDAGTDAAAETIEEPDGADGEGEPVTPVERSGEHTRPGMLLTQRRTWPTRRRLTRQAWRPRGRTRVRRRAAVSSQQPPSLKPSRGFAGVTVAILLLLLFSVVAVQFVASFIGMFTGSGG